MTTLASMVVELTADTGEYLKKMGDAHDKTGGFLSGMQSFGKAAMVGIGAGIAAVGVGVGVAVAALSDCVSAASEAEQITAQLNAVLESTGGAAGVTAQEVQDLALALSETTRFEDDAIVSGQSMLLTFTNIGKDVFPQATETMLNMSTVLGMDLPASAKLLGRALDSPAEGLSALSRMGVRFTADQEKMIQNLVEQGKVAEAQTVILDALEVKFGGAAEAAGQTFAGQLDILRNKLGNVKEAIGASLLPILTRLAETLGPILIGAVEKVAGFFEATILPVIQKVSDAIGAFFRTFEQYHDPIYSLQTALSYLFGPQAAGEIIGVIQQIIGGLTQFKDAIMPVIQPIIDWVANNVQLKDVLLAVGVAIAAVVLPALWSVIAAAAPVIAVGAALIAAFALLRSAWESDWGGIRSTLTQVWEGTLKPALTELWNWLQTNVPLAIQTLTNFWNNTLLPAIQAVWGFIQNNLMPQWRAVADLLSAVVGKALEALAGLWQNVLQPALSSMWTWIKDKVGPVLKDFGDKILPPIKGAFEGIGTAIEKVIGWLHEMATKIRNLQLPDWLTPGSPTPFEMGLRGIADALQQIDKMDMPGVFTGDVPGLAGVNGSSSSRSTVVAPVIIDSRDVTNAGGEVDYARVGALLERMRAIA